MISSPFYIITTPPDGIPNLGINNVNNLQILSSLTNSQNVLPLQTVPLIYDSNPMDSITIEDVKVVQPLLAINSVQDLQTLSSSSDQNEESSEKVPLSFDFVKVESTSDEITEPAKKSPVAMTPEPQVIEETTFKAVDTNNTKTIETSQKSKQKDKKKRINLTVEEKLKVLDDIKSDKRMIHKYSLMYNMNTSTIRHWRQQEQKMRNARSKENIKNRKRLRINTFSHMLNKAVYVWFKKKAKEGMTFTGPIIRRKALEINEKLGGKKDFSASEGWLHNWKKSFNLSGFVYTKDSSAESIEEESNENENQEERDENVNQEERDKDENQEKRDKDENQDERNESQNQEERNESANQEERNESESERQEEFEQISEQNNEGNKDCESNIEKKDDNDKQRQDQVIDTVITHDEVVGSLEKVMKYFEINGVASSLEMNVLLRLQQKAQELKINGSQKRNKSPEFFVCN